MRSRAQKKYTHLQVSAITATEQGIPTTLYWLVHDPRPEQRLRDVRRIYNHARLLVEQKRGSRRKKWREHRRYWRAVADLAAAVYNALRIELQSTECARDTYEIDIAAAQRAYRRGR